MKLKIVPPVTKTRIIEVEPAKIQIEFTPEEFIILRGIIGGSNPQRCMEFIELSAVGKLATRLNVTESSVTEFTGKVFDIYNKLCLKDFFPK